ncbi:MAG: DNA-binding transcriptional LysR family regulator [Bradymonadia bacterium]|jgi:DNA-binding transcriptional LysR family regulator
MPSADRLVEFVTIVDAGSISGAARELGLPRTTVSRRIKRLEEELDVRLLHRETRRLALTHAGELLLERARCVVEDTAAAWRAVAQADDEPRGRLRVSLPPATLHHGLIFGFVDAYPQVDLELASSTRHVDLLADRVDVALRFGGTLDPGLIARRLATDRSSAVAAPQYLAREGRPRDVTDLVGHRCLLTFARDWRRAERWPLRDGGTVMVAGGLVSDEVPLRLQAALRGLGIALLPDSLTKPYRDSGQLEFVCPDELGVTTSASIVFPERKFVPLQVRAFIDYAVAFYASGLSFDWTKLPAVSPNPVR